jgi:DNA-binding SARP family transcriptional activator
VVAEPGPLLRVSLLGSFEVLRAGRLLQADAWRSRQNRTIMKVLLTRRDSVVSVDQIIEILWPVSDPERARRYVHVRISQLRRLLCPEGPAACIVTVEDGYVWNPDADCWVDVDAFEAQTQLGHDHLERGELPEAVSAYEAGRTLYRGDLLADTPYADWALAERERLRDRYLTAMTELAEAYAQMGRYRRALALCHEGLTLDPSREALFVRLMLYHYYSGERTQALETYDRCCYVLEQDLDVAPLPETQALAAQIRDGTFWQQTDAPRYPPPAYEGRLFEVPYSLGNVPLVGREREYAWLVEQWRAGDGRAVLVEGEAGVGKSRLVEELVGYAASQGAAVLIGRCRSGDALAYGPLVAAVRSYGGLCAATALPLTTWAAVTPLFPEFSSRAPELPQLPSLSPREEQDRLEDALVQLLTASVPARSVLFLEDVHRADLPTLSLIPRLAQHVTVVLTARSEELPPDHPLHEAVRELRRCGRFAVLALEPLAAPAVAELLHQLAGGAQPDLARELLTQAGGNPLFLLSSVQWLFEQGELYVDVTGRWVRTRSAAEALPPTVRAVIEERLRRLARTPRRLFDLIAVIAQDFDFALLQKASHLGEGLVLDALDVLLDSRLVAETRAVGRAEYAPAHDCYLEVAYDTLPKARRRQYHRRVADAIVAEAGDPDAVAATVALHYERAADAAHAFTWLVRAGDVALQRYAHTDAHALYQRAIAVEGGEVAPVHERLGGIAHTAAQYADGVAHYTRALGRWEALGELEDQIRTRFRLAECHRELSQFSAAADHARAGLALAESAGDRADLVAQGHIILSNALRSGQLAPTATIRAHLERAGALARQAEAWQALGEATFWLGVVTVNSGDPAGALAHDREALARFRQTGRTGWQSMTLNNLAYHALLAGRPDEALSAAQEGLAQARSIGARNSQGWLLSTLGEIQLYLGELDAARTTLEEGLALVSTWGPVRLRPGFQHDLARVAMAQGAWSRAQALLTEAIAAALDSAPQFVPRLRVALAEALLGLGEATSARDEARQAQGAACEKLQRSVEGCAWRVIARSGVASEDFGDAEAAFARSLALLEAVGDDLEVARTRAAWGWELKQRDDPRAHDLLSLARETFVSCRAHLDLRQLDTGPPGSTPL